MLSWLQDYTPSYGHGNVPIKWAEDRHLAKRLSHQRMSKKMRKLTGKQVCRQSRLGFRWELRSKRCCLPTINMYPPWAESICLR